jgi:WD40 repeat protein
VPADDLAPGSRLGGCRVIGLLGRGGMGVVYEAEDEQLGRTVALKVMAEAAGYDLEARERFLREARAGAAVHHRGIVAIHRAGEDRGRLFLVLDLVAGSSLEARLARTGPLPWREVIAIGAAVARALAAIHAAGLVHRDVKPANILLAEGEGADAGPRLSDFGLARGTRAGLLGSRSLTATGEVVGTPEYLAPEQANAERAVDGQADLYGLGATLHALLTGEPPFHGQGIGLLKKHLLDKPRPVRETRSEVPASLERLVLRLLDKDPAARGKGASAVADELEAIAREKPRRRSGAAVLAALACAGLAAIALASTRPAPEHPAPIRPPAPPAIPPDAPSPIASSAKPVAPAAGASRWALGKYWLLGTPAGSPVTCLAFSPGADRVVAGYEDGSLRCFDVASPDSHVTVTEGGVPIRSVAFLPDRRRVAVGRESGTIELYELRQGAKALPVTERPSDVVALAALPDGRLFSGSFDGTVAVQDLSGQGETRLFTDRHKDGARVVTVAPDGRVAFTGAWDGSLRRWDLATGASREVFPPAKGLAVKSLALTLGTLAVGRADGRVWLVDLDALDRAPVRFELAVGADAVALRPDGSFVAVGMGANGWSYVAHGHGGVDWCGESWPIRSTVSVHALDQGLRYAARGTEDGQVEVMRVGRHPLVSYPAASDGTAPLANHRLLLRFLADGKHAAIAWGNTVRIVDARTGSDARTPVVHEGGAVKALEIVERSRVAAGYETMAGLTEEIFDLTEGVPERVTLSPIPRVETMAIPGDSPFGAWWCAETDIFSGSAPGKETTHARAHDRVRAIAVSSDGRRLVSGGQDGRFKLWRPDRPDPLGFQDDGDARFVGVVAITPDGKTAAAAGGFRDGTMPNGFVETYDLGAKAIAADGPTPMIGEVTGIALSDDGSQALTGTNASGIATLWVIHHGEKPRAVDALMGYEKVVATAISPDGTRALTADAKGAVSFWDITPD